MSRDRIIQVYRGTTAQNDAFTGAAGEITMDTTRKELRVHDGSTAGGNLVGLKPGFVCPFAGTTAPDGWLICDGSAVSRTTYADLFAVIGTTYGAGDGNSTFNLPNMYLRSPMQSGLGSMGATSDGSVPNITGVIGQGDSSAGTYNATRSGAFYFTNQSGKKYLYDRHQTNNDIGDIGFSASRSSACYGRYSDNKIIPSFIHMPWYIKY